MLGGLFCGTTREIRRVVAARLAECDRQSRLADKCAFVILLHGEGEFLAFS